jgi:two-component system sensor histidine kinase HydH
VETSIDISPGLPQVSADPDQIRQVLLNLVVNALEAMNGRGRLTLSARPLPDRVEVVVEDDGPGLPPGDPEQIFDPFFSTRDRGTGLGLAIARRIIRAHGGQLSAGTSAQGGAHFSFTLPLEGDAK